MGVGACWPGMGVCWAASCWHGMWHCKVDKVGACMGVFLLAGLYTYNTWGRSGVDGNDQLREMLNMARRRCVRDGTKGMLFLFDITLTNGYIMWKMVREVTLWVIGLCLHKCINA